MESVMELPITLDFNVLCGGCKFWDGLTKRESCINCNAHELFAYSIEQNKNSDMSKPVMAGVVMGLFVGVALVGCSWFLLGS